MFFRLDKTLARLLRRFPGRKTFGIYNVQPIFFGLGALLEFSMINWEAGPNKHNFYKTFTKNLAREIAEKEIFQEEVQKAKQANDRKRATEAV